MSHQMKNKSDGIACDLCGLEKEKEFTYFSLDVREVSVSDNRFPTGIEHQLVVSSIDACMSCMDKLAEVVGLHYTPTIIGVNCDICGGKMRGSFNFYYCLVTQIEVSLASGKSICAGCGSGMDSRKPCKCGSVNVKKIAQLKIDDKYLQIILCNNDYQGIVARVAKTKQRLGQTNKV